MNIQHNSTTAQHTKMIKMREKVTATMVRAAAAWWTTICPPLAGDWLAVTIKITTTNHHTKLEK